MTIIVQSTKYVDLFSTTQKHTFHASNPFPPLVTDIICERSLMPIRKKIYVLPYSKIYSEDIHLLLWINHTSQGQHLQENVVSKNFEIEENKIKQKKYKKKVL